ncbi:SdpI family protein [Micromonospora arborensis]|uniref:SdpI family protein n=1 Tax=Micromonospora arborensis TaxID=2116518 RepID=UPI001FCA4870|nr:SdpI family protein [Micromonospora arborensis]
MFVSVVYAFLGWLVAYTARVALRPSVGRYRSPGVRTPQTLRSAKHWHAAHRRVARPLHRTGILLAAASPLPVILGVAFGDPPVIAAVLVLAVLVVPYLLYLGHLADRAAAAVDAER